MELFSGQPKPVPVKQIDAGLHCHMVPEVVLSNEERVTELGCFEERLCIGRASAYAPFFARAVVTPTPPRRDYLLSEANFWGIGVYLERLAQLPNPG